MISLSEIIVYHKRWQTGKCQHSREMLPYDESGEREN